MLSPVKIMLKTLKGLFMLFTRSKIVIFSTLAASLLLSACSKSEDTQKSDGTLTATAPATGQASNLTERNTQQRLIKKLENNFKAAKINAKIIDIKPTEVPNLYWVNLEGMSAIYTTADGQYIFQGDLLRLGDKKVEDIGQSFQSALSKQLLSGLKTEDLIVYPAKSKAKHIIYVFTDISCPYCHKLHEHMDEINAKGIEVRYIAWPRGEQYFPAMESVWCSENRKAAFDQAISGTQLAPAACQNPVKDQYQLGLNIGVNGTPAIYSTEGVYLGGYMTADEILKSLNN